MTQLPLRTAISNTYPLPSNATAKSGLGQIWDSLNETIQAGEVHVASAATVDIGNQESTRLYITGTTTITSFGSSYRSPIMLRFAGALTITHNAITLRCPGNADITTETGDVLIVWPTAATISGTADGWQVAQFNGEGGNLPFVNIRDYGAVGDGVTNNFQAITDAIAAANGRKILVPMDSAGGDYAVTSGALALTSAVVFEYEAGAKIRASGSGSITNTGSREIGFGGAGGTNNQGSAKSTIGLYISTGAGTSGFSPAIENSNNAIWIQNDTVDVEASGGSKSHGLLVDHRYGSSTTKGGRIGLQTRLAQLAATSTSNSDRNYTAVVGNSTTSTGDGGAAGSEKGAYFGLSGVATLAAGATDTLNATGAEFNTYVFTGASTKYRTGIQIVGGGNVRGSNTDCAISVYNHSGAVTFKDGICFGGPDEAATFSALDTTGTAFRMRQTTGITNLIDCTAPVSGNILSYLNGLHNVKITPTLFQGNSQSFGLELGRVAAVNSPFIDFHSSGNGVDYDTRIHSSGGTASVGQGTLNYTAATHSFVGGMKFGTFTANAGATIAGYITITDAAGNSRKLLVAA